MTSHHNSHGTTDIKPEMLSGVQTGNGTSHDKYKGTNRRGATEGQDTRARALNSMALARARIMF